MTRQNAFDAAEVKRAHSRGYVVVGGLESSVHLHWHDRCRERGAPFLAIFPREPTFETDYSACPDLDLDDVRALYKAHGLDQSTAVRGHYVHYNVKGHRAYPVAEAVWKLSRAVRRSGVQSKSRGV